MESVGRETRERPVYVAPRVVATYSREDLAEAIRPHGQVAGYQQPGCGGGCGCGNILP